jgi:hypothetical protein
MPRCSIFVGSSTESLDFAHTIQVLLDDFADVTVWSQGVFGLGQTTIEALEAAMAKFDFAVLVFGADDLVLTRGVEQKSARDNILIETGLFVGRFGRERTFLVCAKDEAIKIPTDLAGLSVAGFLVARHSADPLASLGPACTQIRRAVQSLGPRHTVGHKGHHSVGMRLLKGPQQILEAIVESLTAVNLANAVIYRVLPMELIHGVLNCNQGLSDEYEKLIKHVITEGTHDIGFWDKTIYGRALHHEVNEKTSEFIRATYIPCPDTTFIGVDEDYNHIGFLMMGESPTGFPSDFLWHRAIVFFGDPESRRGTPISGFITNDHTFVETVLHKWWKVLETSCQRKGQFWDARVYTGEPSQWQGVIDRICRLIQDDPLRHQEAAS